MDLTALIIKMVIFFALMSLGYFMARKKYLSDHFIKDGSVLLVNIFLVASIVNSVLGERPTLSSKEFAIAFILTSATIIICYVIAFIFSRPFKNENNEAQTELLLGVTNNLFVGLPVLSSMFGSEAVFYIGLSCIAYNLVLYSYGVWRLRHGTGSIKLTDMITIPFLASIVSLIIFSLDLKVPAVFSDLVSTIAAGTVPLSMIVIGASLGKVNPLEAFREKRFYYLSLIRLVICPIIIFFIVRIFTDNPVLIASCLVLGGCPSAIVVTPLSVKYGYDTVYSSKMVMVSTMLSMFTIPILLKVLM